MIGRRSLIEFFALLGACSIIAACASTPPAPAASSAARTALPLANGTTWVYDYVEYEPAGDPTQIITATYRMTETVVDTQSIDSYFVAHVRHTESVVTAPPDWPSDLSSRPTEFWYVVGDRQIYDSLQAIDSTGIHTDTMILAYDLPLAIGHSWCPSMETEGAQLQGCVANGKRTVVSQGSYDTLAGKFNVCYQVTEDFNSGGVTRWFCDGAGVVAQQYDHAGTRFGFQQTLVSYTPGSP
jgi:hypothetical protein